MRLLGHDAAHVGADLRCPTALDEEIVRLAAQQDRVVLTSDLDFGQLLASGDVWHPGAIVLRIGSASADEQAAALGRVLDALREHQIRGHIVTVTRTRVRRRRLPD